MTTKTAARAARFAYLTTTNRASLKDADKAVQKMTFDAMIDDAADESARDKLRAAYARLAPEVEKKKLDKYAAAAKAQVTRKANAASSASAFLASLNADAE